MDGLPVDAFPVRGPFVVGEGVEERFPERRVRGHVLAVVVFHVVGVVGGVGTPFGAVVVMMMMMMAAGVVGGLGEG